jgi:hypothetical protein
MYSLKRDEMVPLNFFQPNTPLQVGTPEAAIPHRSARERRLPHALPNRVPERDRAMRGPAAELSQARCCGAWPFSRGNHKAIVPSDTKIYYILIRFFGGI